MESPQADMGQKFLLPQMRGSATKERREKKYESHSISGWSQARTVGKRVARWLLGIISVQKQENKMPRQ